MNTGTLISDCAPAVDLQVLQKQGVLPYTAVEEGELVVTRMAQVPDDVDTSRVTFVQVRSCRAACVLGRHSLLCDREQAVPAAKLQQLPAQLQHCLLWCVAQAVSPRLARCLYASFEPGVAQLFWPGPKYLTACASAAQFMLPGTHRCTSLLQADPCRLPTELRKNFDAVLMSNLLDRLADPECVLNQLPDLLRPGGIAVIASPYSWSETWTPKPKWLGGRYEVSTARHETSFGCSACRTLHNQQEPTTFCLQEGGIAVHTFEKLRQIMEHNHFELIEQRNLPYLIREHSRKYQLCLAHATVWRRHRDRPSPRSVT